VRIVSALTLSTVALFASAAAGLAQAENMSGLNVASRSPASTTSAPSARGPADATDAQPTSAELARWLLWPSGLATPVDDAAREALGNSLRLGDVGALRLRDPSVPDEPFMLRTSGSDRASTDLRKLMETGERWHLLAFGLEAGLPAQDAEISARGQVAYLPGGDAGARDVADDAQDPIAIDLKLALEGFEVGVGHRSFGKRLDRAVTVPQVVKDRESSEVWLAQRVGVLGLKLAHSETSDNVDRDPALAQTTRDQTSVTAELKLSDWPILGVTYAVGDAERVWLAHVPAVRAPARQAFESLIGSVYYAGDHWDVNASSTYSRSREAVGPEDASTSMYYDLALTLRLADALTLVPAVGMGVDRYSLSQTLGGTSYASATLSYAPPARAWRAWTSAAYTDTRSSDRTADARSVSVAGGVAHDLGKVLSGRASLSLQVGYSRYADEIYPAVSSEGAFAFALFTLARF